jgi:hypothetical protein
MNILGSSANHPYVPTSGLGGSFPSGLHKVILI